MNRQKTKWGIMFLIFAAIAMQLAALDFDVIEGKITCNMLRRAYEGVWYRPQCQEDGSFKNPQCFKGFHFCCCVNNVAKENQSTAWLGDCARLDNDPKKLPKCDQGTMLQSETR